MAHRSHTLAPKNERVKELLNQEMSHRNQTIVPIDVLTVPERRHIQTSCAIPNIVGHMLETFWHTNPLQMQQNIVIRKRKPHKNNAYTTQRDDPNVPRSMHKQFLTGSSLRQRLP